MTKRPREVILRTSQGYVAFDPDTLKEARRMLSVLPLDLRQQVEERCFTEVDKLMLVFEAFLPKSSFRVADPVE